MHLLHWRRHAPTARTADPIVAHAPTDHINIRFRRKYGCGAQRMAKKQRKRRPHATWDRAHHVTTLCSAPTDGWMTLESIDSKNNFDALSQRLFQFAVLTPRLHTTTVQRQAHFEEKNELLEISEMMTQGTRGVSSRQEAQLRHQDSR